MSAAAFSCVSSKMLSVATVTNSNWCPLVLYSCKNRHSAVLRLSEQQLKVNSASQQEGSNLQSKARFSFGGIGASESSNMGKILLRSLPLVATSTQESHLAEMLEDEAPPQDVQDEAPPQDVQDETPPEFLDLPVVKVKFSLQKECLFGQKFSVVGEDILLGAWDPNAAFDLEWSKDHTWIGELDLPLGKKYEFKFLLTGEDGEVHWQPGPNLIFETLENALPLIVSEPWYSEETNKIDEVPADVSEALSKSEDIDVGNSNVATAATEETLDVKQDETGNGIAHVAGQVESAVAAVLPTLTGDTEDIDVGTSTVATDATKETPDVGTSTVATDATKETPDVKQDETGNGAAVAAPLESVVAAVLLTSTGNTEEQQATNSEY
ncbi:hypothetical protein O6H91_05G069000 [Diphasiastrum complanatum]|uniref:Uncharacterized protein n=1 Tax=Diphasiastrum complanatum TaxID=34168 RepID=A0ACC2DPA6_DIPCM|nr:hypothetical protein O6H91_Y032800 [Diphasiastrum complanatum]KAJ7556111.1 hypothetical protein O6H91_05G069000 [Diphasiastrum complanatum]